MHTRAHARTHTCACTHTQEAGVQDCSVNTDAVQMRKGRIREARPGAVGGLAGQRQGGVAHRSKSRGGRGWKEDSRLQGREETSQQSAGEGRVCEVPSMLARASRSSWRTDRLLSLCSPRASGLLSQDEGEGGWSARPRAPNCIGDRMSKTPAREAQGLPTPLTRPPLGPPHT